MRTLTVIISLMLAAWSGAAVTGVQPMTGIVLWADNTDHNATDAVQLEYAYMDYDAVAVTESAWTWTPVDSLLDAVAGRGHQAVFRFRFTYPGYATTVPAYIKALPEYDETVGTSEGLTTYFPDWTGTELQAFTLDFYGRFAERYDDDPRLAFLQTGFGLWAEYHIYDGPFTLGGTFPAKEFQADFFRHLDSAFTDLPWSISIDAADDTYSPFSAQPALKDLGFGLFDDSFMHEEHDDYNADCWAFFGADRYRTRPAGGEFSYYTDYDQEHVLDTAGMYGTTFEQAAAAFHITYMIGNDQPEYRSMDRIRDAGMACGYRFRVTDYSSAAGSTFVTVENRGNAPLYRHAYPAVSGIRSAVSLKGLCAGTAVRFGIGTTGTIDDFSIECDHLVAGQEIQFDVDPAAEVGAPGRLPLCPEVHGLLEVYAADGCLVRSVTGMHSALLNSGIWSDIAPGMYLWRIRTSGRSVAGKRMVMP